MASTKKTKKQLLLEQDKIRRVRKIVNARTDNEAITRALDIIIENTRIETMLRSVRGKGSVKDVYGRMFGQARQGF